jgi:uncharacterized protein (DUF488 family)
VILTIGHSTRTLDEFLGLLRAHRVSEIVDVRRYPASRRYPHFSRERLAAELEARGIGYHHEPDLGGRRQPRPDSRHTAWRAAAFRGYADHMESPEFQAALGRLIDGSAARIVAIMCAEAVPWRCHRQLIADALVARGMEVAHVLGAARPAEHALSPHARVGANGVPEYPRRAPEGGLFPE